MFLKLLRDKNISRRRRIFHGGWISLLLAFLLTVGWYIYYRASSGTRAVKRYRRADVPPTEGKPASNPIETLRVGIYNVAHGRGDAEYGQSGIWENLVVNLTGSSAERIKRLNAIADTLKEQDLDIIILNEADFRAFWSDNINQARYIAARTGHAHILEQRNHDLDLPFFDIKFGNAVLSRYPVISAASLDFPAYRWWENVLLGRKKGAVCEIRLSENQTVRLVPVHLDVRSTEVRIDSVKVIQQLCDRTEHPMIAAGDFNSTRPGWPKAEPNAEGQTAVGYLTQVGCFDTLPRDEFTETDFTFASSDPVKIIDWIMVSEPLQIVDRQVLDAQDLSDHFPVVSTIKTSEERF